MYCENKINNFIFKIMVDLIGKNKVLKHVVKKILNFCRFLNF